nr:hypothetical protein [Tanacetum cinerariifolium]
MKKKKNAASGAGGSGIFVIELNTILNRSWIYDTGCGTHICNTTQGLRASKKLKPGALSLYVGNGQREAVEAIGAFYLCLPSGLDIVLNNCHYAPSITRGVISVSRLYEDGFVNRFMDNTIQVSRNNVVYFSDILRDENQLGKTIKLLGSDRGGEYMSQEFLDHLRDHGIIAHRTPLYTPQHNDVSERRNRTLLDMRDTLTKPDKVKPKSNKCIFIGYLKETIRYSFYNPPENKVLVAQNAEFLENSLIDQEASGSLEDLEIIQEEDTHPSLDTSLNNEQDDLEIDEPQSDIVPIRRLKQASRQWNKRFDDEIKKFGFTQNRDESCVYLKASGSNITFLILFHYVCCEMYSPDVAFAQNVTSRFQQNPGDIHWTTVKNILKYLRNTKDMFIVYKGDLKQELRVSCYIDAGYLTDADDLKSQTGYVFILNGGAIDWKSVKQSIFATSSAEAKYIAAFDAFKEAV